MMIRKYLSSFILHISFMGLIFSSAVYSSSSETDDFSCSRTLFHGVVNENDADLLLTFKKGRASSQTSTEAVEKTGAWNTLPSEIWFMIFDDMSFPTLGIVQHVCKHWHDLVHHEMFSLKGQILRHPLSTLFEKANFREDILSALRKSIAKLACDPATGDAFFNSPQAFQKALLDPSAIGYALRSSLLLPRLLKSTVTAASVLEVVGGMIITEDQYEALTSYVKDAPHYQGAFSDDFIKFAQDNAHYYKTFNLLCGFGHPAGKPFKELVHTIHSRLDPAKDCETTSFLMAGALYLELTPDLELEVRQYCLKQAQLSSDKASQRLWEGRAAIPCAGTENSFSFTLSPLQWSRREEMQHLRHLSTHPENALAPLQLAVMLREEKRWAAAEYYLRLSAIRGNINAQYTLGSQLVKLGYFEEAENFLRLALEGYDTRACFKHAEACLNLGCAFIGQEKIEEASLALNIAAEEGDDSIKHAIERILKAMSEEPETSDEED